MHYLIDGHNLIAQIPDISLNDPDDEAKLVLRLRSWMAAGRKRQVTVIFDGGLPGGTWRYMSRGKLKALFATEGQTADALLINRIRQIDDPSAYTVVTSDQEILDAAKKRRIPFMTTDAFAQQLQKVTVHEETSEVPGPSNDVEPSLSEDEIDEWMAIFNTDQELQSRNDSKVRESSREEDDQEKATGSPQYPMPNGEPTILKSGDRKLSSVEVDEWLELFQDGGENQATKGPEQNVD